MRRPPFRLALHPLEDRLTPAGNLTARVVAGSLHVTGDREANSVAVTQTAPGSFTLTPEDGTTLNGQADPVTLSGVTRDLVLRLGRGDDAVRLGAQFSGSVNLDETLVVGRDLILDAGPGNNFVDNPIAAVEVGRDLRLANGDGGSLVQVRGRLTVGRDLTARGGNGVNILTVSPDRFGLGFAGQSTVRGDLTVRNRAGGSDVTLSDLSVGGDVRVESGPGGEFTATTGFGAVLGPAKAWVGGDLTFRAVGGLAAHALRDADVRGDVRFESGPFESVNSVLADDFDVVIGGDLSIRAGARETRVELGAESSESRGLTIHGDLDVRTGAGEDRVSLAHVRVNAAADIRTGADADQVAVDDVMFGGRLDLRTGAGNDLVVIEGQVPDDFESDRFAGTTDLWERSDISLGGGDDTLRLGAFEDPARAVRLFALLRADGGAGTDLLDAANVTPAGRLQATRFEVTPPPPVFRRPVQYGVNDEYDYVTDVEAADLDGDLDLATANRFGNNQAAASVQFGNGDGTFGPAVSWPADGVTNLTVGDFNNDGNLDVAGTGFNQVGVVVFGNGGRTFQAPRPFDIGPNPGPLTAADLNADGWLDLAVGNQDEASVAVVLNRTAG